MVAPVSFFRVFAYRVFSVLVVAGLAIFRLLAVDAVSWLGVPSAEVSPASFFCVTAFRGVFLMVLVAADRSFICSTSWPSATALFALPPDDLPDLELAFANFEWH